MRSSNSFEFHTPNGRLQKPGCGLGRAGADTFAYLLILHSTLLIVKEQIRDSNWARLMKLLSVNNAEVPDVVMFLSGRL